MPQITITGEINSSGKAGYYQQNMLNDFCTKHPNERLVITFQAEKKQSKNALLAYYYAAIIPAWQKALFDIGTIKSTDKIDDELRQLCDLTRKGKSLSALPYEGLILFIDTVRFHGLEDLNIVFQDPRCL